MNKNTEETLIDLAKEDVKSFSEYLDRLAAYPPGSKGWGGYVTLPLNYEKAKRNRLKRMKKKWSKK